MTTTLDAVKSKKQDSSAEETAAKELVRLATEVEHREGDEGVGGHKPVLPGRI